MRTLVSVIIPTTDGDKHLDACIKSIERSTYTRVQIIVVNEGKERSAQRNSGIERSSGDYLLFLDSDMTVHPNLIAECVFLMASNDGIYIPEIILGRGFWRNVRNFERSFYDGTRIDAIRFVKRVCLKRFDENLTGVEDWDFDRRFVGEKVISTFPIYHNESDFNLWRYIRKKSYYCRWVDAYKKIYGNCPELDFKYRYWTVFMEHGRWRRVVSHPVLFLGVMFLKFLIGVAYLCRRAKY